MRIGTIAGTLLTLAVAGQALGQQEPRFRSWDVPLGDAANNPRISEVRIYLYPGLSAQDAAQRAVDELLSQSSSEPVLMIQNFVSATGLHDTGDYHVPALPSNTRGFNLWYNNGITAAHNYIGDMLSEFNTLKTNAVPPNTFCDPALIILDEETPIAIQYWNWNCVVGIAALDDIDPVIYNNSDGNYTVYGFDGKDSAKDIIANSPELYVDLTKVDWEKYAIPNDYPDGISGRPAPSIINVANWLQARYPQYNSIGSSPPSLPLYIHHTRKYLGVAWQRVAQQVRTASLEEGLIEPLRNGAASGTTGGHGWGSSLEWSNYDSSLSLDNGGAPGIERYFKGRGYEDTRGASKFFWDGAGSFDSPVLYPKSNCYAQTGEDRMDATLRIDRDNLNAIAESVAGNGDHPIMPWLLTADLIKDEYNIQENEGACGSPPVSSYTADKSFFRDMVAMCRAKGVTDYILWGQRHGTTPYASLNPQQQMERDAAWSATSEAIDQVWDYQLDDVSVTAGSGNPSTGTATDSVRFSEQKPLQATNTSADLVVEADFSKDDGHSAPSRVALLVEVIEGDQGTNYGQRILKIRNQCSGSWETVSATPTEVSQGRWETANGSKILRWEIDITGLSSSCSTQGWSNSRYVNYNDGSIDFQLAYTPGTSSPAIVQIDLMQLYAIDDPSSQATFEEGLNQIGTALEGDTVTPGQSGDFNHDGVINKIDDLIALVEQERSRH